MADRFFVSITGIPYQGDRAGEDDTELKEEEYRAYIDTVWGPKTRIKKLKRYLQETDWYVIRKNETGKTMPDDVLKKRASAREEMNILRDTLKAST